MGIRAEIARSVAEAILAHAASSPEEVCGLLLCPGEGGDPAWAPAFAGAHLIAAAVPCANVHPTPATHFELDPAALLAAHRAARVDGPQVIGHYHSHPSGLARPSVTDAAHAPPDGALWLIVAGDEITAWQAVTHGALHDRFDPVELVIT